MSDDFSNPIHDTLSAGNQLLKDILLAPIPRSQAAWVLSVWASLLFRYQQQDHLTIALDGVDPSSRRNTVVFNEIRMDVGMTGEDLYRQIEQRYGFENPAGNPLLHQGPLAECAHFICISAGHPVSAKDIEGVFPAQVDMCIVWIEDSAGVRVLLRYDADRIKPARAELTAKHFEQLWQAMASNPHEPLGELSFMTPQEIQMIRDLGMGPYQAEHSEPLYQWIEHHARQSPQAAAVRYESLQLTYAELNAKANRLARTLRQHGVQAHQTVASFFEPCPEVMVAMLAIHKAGGVYVPLDPTHPGERISVLLNDIRPKVLLSLEYLLPRISLEARIFCLDRDVALWSHNDASNLCIATDLQQTAYIVYTSGTTGKPKGVMASHANLNHYIFSAQQIYGISASDRMPALARFTFSITMFELWSPLVAGGELHLVPRALVLDFARMVTLLTTVTVVHCSPSLMRNLLNYMDAEHIDTARFSNLRHVSCGGDFVSFELLERMKRTFASAEIFVIYGCTEISCMGCTDLATRKQTLTHNSVGRAMFNIRLQLLDAQLKPVPLGVKGEVCFAGPGINQGYWNLPALTRERFVEIDGQRYYRTGDWGKLDAQGRLELLGRTDFQIKLRGIRVEPIEIETALRQYPGIRDALVSAKAVQGGEEALVAYLSLFAGYEPDVVEIRRFLQSKLPEYMVPALYVALDALPTNVNGKLDRSALPTPTASMLLRQAQSVAPVTPTEQVLAEIWSRVLHIHPIQRNSDFFLLGGDSMSSVLMLLEVEKLLRCQLPMDAPLRTPTLQALAKAIDDGAMASSQPGLVPLRSGGDKQAFYCVYGALFYRELSSCLKDGRPVYGAYLPEEIDWLAVQYPTPEQTRVSSVPEIASRYLAIIRASQPQGPYLIAGHSFGGLVAYELTQQIIAAGGEVALLVLMDCAPSDISGAQTRRRTERIRIHLKFLREQGCPYFQLKLAGRLLPWFRRFRLPIPRSMQEAAGLQNKEVASRKASQGYQPRPYGGKVLLLRAIQRHPFQRDERADLGWGQLVDHLIVRDVPGDHHSMLKLPNVQVSASCIDEQLDASQ